MLRSSDSKFNNGVFFVQLNYYGLCRCFIPVFTYRKIVSVMVYERRSSCCAAEAFVVLKQLALLFSNETIVVY